MGKFLAIISSMKSNDRKNIIITFLIILLIPIIFLNFFLSIFIYKSNDPQDKYLISAEQVAFELNTPNRLDGNLIKSIYFLYKYKETEELWEIKKFIKDFFVNSYIGYDENGMPMIFYFFKSYLEIQAMLLLPPFSFSPTEMILINLYLFMPPDDFDDDINIGEIPDGGHIEGGNGNIDNIGGGGEKPNYLPFRVKSPCNGTITSYYGLRTHPVTGEKLSFHSGIDIRGQHHQPITSVADGVIVSANTAINGYGNYVKIKHTIEGITFYSFYAHLSEITVSVGDTVTVGAVIGLEGGEPNADYNPGTSTGHHLHFEIRLNSSNSSCIDPAPYLEM